MNTSHCPCCRQQLPDTTDLIVDEASGTIIHNGMAVALPPTEFDLFFALFKTPGRVVNKEQIYQNLYWNRHGDADIEIKIIDVLVCKIRPALAEIGVEIKTHWGRGYSLSVDPAKREAA